MTRQYRFVGDGAGVPGLPHELTDDEARRLGVESLLADALKIGTYQEIAGSEEQPRTRPPRGVKPPAEESD